MILNRKIFYQLENWKQKNNRKSLVLQGARQVGKTYALREFGRRNYEEVLEINFKKTPSDAGIFNGNLNVDTLITAMQFRYPEKKMIPGKTLIVLDEIQECEEAITSLKFWTEDGRFDVVASGSMLGIDYKRASSYPVGYVEYLQMYGLDFEEYLWARGIKEEMIENLRQMFLKKEIVPTAIHTRMMELLREFISIGGMPEVVSAFVESMDYRLADKIQRELLTGYQYDIAHYAVAEEKVKAEKCYLSLGKQLLDKENHKFQYKEVESGGRAYKYYSSIDWLLKADLIDLCKAVSDIKYDLSDYARDDIFRAYTTDLSLLISMREFGLKQHIVENTILDNTKGGIYECLLADFLIKKEFPMYYYKNDTTKKEIDFITQKDGAIIPLEVKSGKKKASSLNWLMNNNSSIPIAYKFMDGNVGMGENRIITMPLYMAMFL